jgi:hypothetical protein
MRFFCKRQLTKTPIVLRGFIINEVKLNVKNYYCFFAIFKIIPIETIDTSKEDPP